jgi:transcriptional regulator with XRE-family HTH domain
VSKKTNKGYDLFLTSSPAEIAKAINRDISSISRWFSGRIHPTYRSCKHIADCYGISVAEVVEIIEKRIAGL